MILLSWLKIRLLGRPREGKYQEKIFFEERKKKAGFEKRSRNADLKFRSKSGLQNNNCRFSGAGTYADSTAALFFSRNWEALFASDDHIRLFLTIIQILIVVLI